MSLQGQTVRIIVHKPKNWDKGNLFGTILSDRGGQKLVIKLMEKIIGKQFISDIIELELLTEKETFKPLRQYYSVMVNGFISNDEMKKSELVIYGSVTID